MRAYWGRVKSQTRPLFIRTPDGVRFQIFNSQKGKIPFGSPSLEFWGERSIFAVELEKGGKGFGCSGFPNDCF